MNQLETNFALWAICSIILFEILLIICLCRYCFNRIKPKRFYVKREEYEYLKSNNASSSSKFQSTILRPPHADELALVGTIREQHPTINFDDGIQNFGFHRDFEDSERMPPVAPLATVLSPTAQNFNWIELKPAAAHGIINTAQLAAADYEVRSYSIDENLYTQQSSPSRPIVHDFHQYREEYNGEQYLKDYDDTELENFPFHSFGRPEVFHSHARRTDTSTESFGGHSLSLIPKSILKGSASTTPPLDMLVGQTSEMSRSQTSSRLDQSPRTSVKINTDESIPVDYAISAIEKTVPNDPIYSTAVPAVLFSAPNPMRFASVSQLNEVEWEVPREFQAVAYDVNDDRHAYRSTLVHSPNENLNNNNSNSYSNLNVNDKGRLSNRQRTQSAVVDQRKYISSVYVPWDPAKKTIQPLYLSNSTENGDVTQQKAFEY